eukprot:TRINITY_DN1667_c0_g1_i1.p1 TRINITY_DN1667_c0_g1~~TRINITY_DN1667_c0_g1_i1.p1  ORF type:complete len:994 (-),score=200.78 TRINITY_DN1667_c0_g1_i1:742-3684(-)
METPVTPRTGRVALSLSSSNDSAPKTAPTTPTKLVGHASAGPDHGSQSVSSPRSSHVSTQYAVTGRDMRIPINLHKNVKAIQVKIYKIDDKGSVDVKVMVTGPGQFSVEFKLLKAGQYHMDLLLAGHWRRVAVILASSPTPKLISPNEVECFLNQQVFFVVKALTISSPDDITVNFNLLGSDELEKCLVLEGLENTFKILFTPTQVGTYQSKVVVAGYGEIGALSVMVRPIPIIRCKKKSKKVTIGQPFSFMATLQYVLPQEIKIEITAPDGSTFPPASVITHGDSTISVTFTPLVAGSHSVGFYVSGGVISPFQIEAVPETGRPVMLINIGSLSWDEEFKKYEGRKSREITPAKKDRNSVKLSKLDEKLNSLKVEGMELYVELFFRKECGVSSRHRSEVSTYSTPTWNFKVKLPLKSDYKDLIIEIRDKNYTTSKSDFLGCVVIENIHTLVPKYDGFFVVGPNWKTKDPAPSVTPKGRLFLSWRISSQSERLKLNERTQSQFVGRTIPGLGPKRSDKIAIIGGGCGGIHMAHLLRRNGFQHITILEQSDRIGGKCYTRYLKDIPYEMGACYLNPLYVELAKLLKHYGLTEVPPGDEKSGDFDIYLRSGKNIMKRDDFIFNSDYSDLETDCLPSEKSSLPTVIEQISRYKHIHRKIFGKYKYTFPPEPTPKYLEKLNMPLLDFLTKHKLDALKPLFLLGISGQVCGHLKDIPAFYGLMWVRPELLSTIIPWGKNDKTKSITMVKEGYTKVWEKIVESDDISVLLNYNVSKIKRSTGQVVLGGTYNGKPVASTFDYLVSTLPLNDCAKIIKNPDPLELEIFSEVKHYWMVVTLFLSEKQQNTQAIEITPENLLPENPQRGVFCQRNSVRCLYPKLKESEEETWIAYQLLPPEDVSSNETLLQLFQQDMTQRNIKVLQVLDQIKYPYFYHFSKEDISKGYPWKILDLQGTNRTFYTGASCFLDSVNDIMNYNLMLINRFVYC